MNTRHILQSALLASSLLTGSVFAQSDAPAAPAAPPTIVNPAPVPNQVIYLPQLPNPGDLTRAAAAQGVEIAQMNQTANQIIVVFKYSNGQTNTIAYQLLASAGTAPGVAPATVAAAPAVAPAVVYATPAPAYYYDPYYYSWPWFAPVTVGLGFDFGFHHFHGGYHGGYRGGHGFHH